MKSIRSFWFAVILTLGALGQLAGLALPQSPVQGRFNLPYEVNWENTVVPAGEYEFYLAPAGGPPATSQSTHSCQSAPDPSWPDGPSG
jgi:hypothetical protein